MLRQWLLKVRFKHGLQGTAIAQHRRRDQPRKSAIPRRESPCRGGLRKDIVERTFFDEHRKQRRNGNITRRQSITTAPGS
jgi:hypothetical protein